MLLNVMKEIDSERNAGLIDMDNISHSDCEKIGITDPHQFGKLLDEIPNIESSIGNYIHHLCGTNTSGNPI